MQVTPGIGYACCQTGEGLETAIAFRSDAREPQFLGCITEEPRLLGKVYLAGASANFSVAMQHASDKELPFMAIARTRDLAHLFAFAGLSYGDDKLASRAPDKNIEGCKHTCRDDPAKYCGSADGYNGVNTPRVWALYSSGAHLKGTLVWVGDGYVV
jgi:hypothetical protein